MLAGRADVFALGLMLAAMLTGKPAVLGADKREIIDHAARAEDSETSSRLDACGAEAEPLLRKGYGGMKACEKTPADDADRLDLQQRLAETVDRLIELSLAIEKPREVRKCQAEWDKLQPARPGGAAQP